MGKTRKRTAKRPLPCRQAPPGAWSPDELQRALASLTDEQGRAILIEIGILTKDGKPGSRYQGWGNVVSRTADYGVTNGEE